MKKGLTLMLAFIMVFTVQAATVSAASFTDTVGAPCETAADVLSALGIVEGKAEGSYEPDSSLTRAEMATIILRAMHMAQGAKGQDIFTDVPASHWAYANVSAAYQMGIVNGTSATTFAPDATVTYEQAVKMVVAALGYTVEAEAMGGYPTGYLAKAAHLDVLKGVSVGGDMTRGNMAILLYNALDKPILEKASYGDDNYKYDSDEAVTMLSRYLKVEKITGKVVQTPMACAITTAARVLSDEVRVSDGETITLMKKGDSAAQDLLGVRAEILYQESENGGMPVILAVIPRSSSEILDIAAKDIDAGKTTAKELIYEENGKEKKADIADATLVYNGRVRTMDVSLLKPEIGTVRLVSETGAAYDLIIVESYENYIVEMVNESENIVYFKDGAGSMEIDFSDNSVNIVLTDENGKPLALKDFAEWDVVSVCRDNAANPSVCRIYRTFKIVDGTITELSVSEREVIIDGTTYPIAYSMKPEDLKLGMNALFSLDFTGAVAAVDTSGDDGGIYAWLKNTETTKGLDGTPRIRVFTQNAEWKILEFAQRVEYNDLRVPATDLLKPAAEEVNTWAYNTAPTLVRYNASGEVETIPQLIKITVTEEGLIEKLETAENKTAFDVEDSERFGGNFSMDFWQNGTKVMRGFNNTVAGDAAGKPKTDEKLEYIDGVLFSRVYADNDTKFFKIPANPENEKQYEVYGAVTGGLNFDDYREMKAISYYDISDRNHCGAMVMRHDLLGTEGDTGEGYPGYTALAGLVTRISTRLDEDGMAVFTISMVNSNGQEIAAGVTDENMECLYSVANVKMEDPAWYTKNAVTGAHERGVDGSWKKTATKRMELYMSLSDLEPGDIIQYKTDADGNITTISVLHRLAYSGDMEFAYGKESNKSSSANATIMPTSAYRYYFGGNKSMLGTVTKQTGKGFLVDVNLCTSAGEPTGETASRAVPTVGKFVIWDDKKQTATMTTSSGVMVGDYIFAFWLTRWQKLVVIYR